jgi:hypothetical protein
MVAYRYAILVAASLLSSSVSPGSGAAIEGESTHG